MRSTLPRGNRAVTPRVSVVIPVRNEAAYLKPCLQRLLAQDYPRDALEILVLDGISDDGTRDIVKHFAEQLGAPTMKLLDNPKRQRAMALNIGIRKASGDVILRIDARTSVAVDYISKCVDVLLRTGADNVGGFVRPVSETPMQEAIGLAMSHPFGVGNAWFRIGRRSGFVDTVYPGCFPRAVFDKVGLFDEEAPIISEDSDMNYRIRQAGGKVYLDAGIVVHYHPRETLTAMWRLYFRYGGARAGNLLKHRALSEWRPLAPVTLTGVLAVLAVGTVVDRQLLLAFVAVVGVYLAADLGVSAILAWQQRRPWLFGRLCVLFPCMHLAFGLGFWRRLTQNPRPGTHWGY